MWTLIKHFLTYDGWQGLAGIAQIGAAALALAALLLVKQSTETANRSLVMAQQIRELEILPITGDRPWVNLILFAIAVVPVFLSVRRAPRIEYCQPIVCLTQRQTQI